VYAKSPDRDMIVVDGMNQLNLSCEAEGNPSVSFIWYKEPDMNYQLSNAWYIPTYGNVDSFSHGIYLPMVTLTVLVMVYTHLL
jgi:hypothetical protein